MKEGWFNMTTTTTTTHHPSVVVNLLQVYLKKGSWPGVEPLRKTSPLVDTARGNGRGLGWKFRDWPLGTLILSRVGLVVMRCTGPSCALVIGVPFQQLAKPLL